MSDSEIISDTQKIVNNLFYLYYFYYLYYKFLIVNDSFYLYIQDFSFQNCNKMGALEILIDNYEKQNDNNLIIDNLKVINNTYIEGSMLSIYPDVLSDLMRYFIHLISP